MHRLRSYGNWSAPVLINDARPLWITPDSAFQTAQLAGLPRVLKIVGHNLQPGPTAATSTRVRLVGQGTGATYVLAASNSDTDDLTTDSLERHVAAVTLPSTLTPDEYTVQVSRDGSSWVGLLGNGQSPPQVFTVTRDPLAPPVFSVSDPKFADPSSGPCRPGDGIDDTACILLAIRAATAAALFIEPSAGVQIQSLTPSIGTCDASISVCTFGDVGARQSATVAVTVSLMSSGSWPVTFSVTHSDADAVPQNDSAEVIEQVQ